MAFIGRYQVRAVAGSYRWGLLLSGVLSVGGLAGVRQSGRVYAAFAVVAAVRLRLAGWFRFPASPSGTPPVHRALLVPAAAVVASATLSANPHRLSQRHAQGASCPMEGSQSLQSAPRAAALADHSATRPHCSDHCGLVPPGPSWPATDRRSCLASPASIHPFTPTARITSPKRRPEAGQLTTSPLPGDFAGNYAAPPLNVTGPPRPYAGPPLDVTAPPEKMASKLDR